ncbi:hypothetical protein HK405_011965, partial [Cladochytrium tenue]
MKVLAAASTTMLASLLWRRSENYEKVLETLDEQIRRAEARLSNLRAAGRAAATRWLLYASAAYAVYLALYFTVWSPVEDPLQLWAWKTAAVVLGPA